MPIVLEGVGTVQALYTATIRSQVTGTLEEVDFSEGEKVKRGQVLAQIDPRTFQAQLDQAKAALGRDQAHLAARLKAIFPNSADKLWPGTFVNAHIITRLQHDGLTVPLTAVLQGPQGPYVYVIKAADGTVETRLVTIVQSRNNQVLISKGLAAGETVVTAASAGSLESVVVKP